ncbi:MAG: OB-fold nucleic acid binding domain-containing protein, partial [bacterium]
AGAAKKGIAADVAGHIFYVMAHFAGYGFNKSHSAAYALVAYQTAYLKANYPVEYMAALISSVMENTDKVALYIEECRRLGIEILPPDINESLVDFSVIGGKIRFGLAAVKNVGRGAIENIIAARQEGGNFVSLTDFCRRVDLRVVNKKVLESLIKCGAFGSLGQYRARMLAGLDDILERAQRYQQEKLSGQHSLLELLGTETETQEDKLPQVPEFTPERLLALEKETVGLYISGHPLAPYSHILREHTVSSKDLEELADGQRVMLGGILVAGKQILTRNGEPMLFATLEDLTGSVEVVVFPRLFSENRSLLVDDARLLVEGVVNWQETEVKIIAERISPLEAQGQGKGVKSLYLALSSRREPTLDQVFALLRQYPGPSPVYLYFRQERKLHQLPDQLAVELQEELLAALEALLGPGEVAVKGGPGPAGGG